MPWTIRYHEQQPREPQPGDMWPEAEWIEGERAEQLRGTYLSEEYFQRWYGKRPPLVVCLPNGNFFCIDMLPSKGASGWDVSGEPPNITVSPSIYNAPGESHAYHGFLTNGVLSDDVDGRTFPRPERS